MSSAPGEPPTFDTSVAHIARVYDYWLGGKDNYAADRKAGDEIIAAYPDIVSSVRANRAFLARTVRYLAAEAGVRQFLDIGTGIPAANNTHEVAQTVAPECRVVYVDYDPVVLAHARALLTSHPRGATAYVDADLRNVEAILSKAADTLDFSRPVAVMLIAIMHLIEDDDDPLGLVARLMDAVPAGSYLAMSHVAADIQPESSADGLRRANPLWHQKQQHRSQAEVLPFFDGLELVPPGVVRIQQWRPDTEAEARAKAAMWGGVARKTGTAPPGEHARQTARTTDKSETPDSDEMIDDMTSANDSAPTFDTSVAHIARVYNYWLGGKDNYAADRLAGDEAIAAYPGLVSSVRANRAFLARAARYLAEAGIQQFLDIGTGIPSANNTHEVVQSVAPDARVVYVDNDPVVLAHARALLTSHPSGVTAYLQADLRDTDTILAEAARTLDFSQPVAIMLIAILHLIGEADAPRAIVARLLDAVPSGSYLAMSHVASDIEPEAMAEMAKRLNRMMAEKGTYRSQAEVTRYFDGLELVPPGVVRIQQWRPDTEVEATARAAMWGAIGRKP
jgi:S-adenosyl methyltransferase